MEKSEKLERLIKKYATSYYGGVTDVPDDYFDSLVEELREIKPESEVLKTGWGFEPAKKVKHWWGLHIGSLPKIKGSSPIPDKYYVYGTRVSAKLDGLSVVSYYIDGKRVQCITRGNGTEGLDVTDKISLIDPEHENLLLTKYGSFTGAIRGEVVMPVDVWNSKYASQKENNPSLNARNIASGFMNRNKLSKNDASDLRYVVYKVLYSDSCKFTSIKDIDEFLTANGFFVADRVYTGDFTAIGMKSCFNRFSVDYPCDGLVFTNFISQNNGEVIFDESAYKFQADSEEVVVTDVTYEATRTGRLAPRIWFNPVELSGAVVRKCTGFNAKFIEENGIGPGAVIKVCRSNEVIPYIMKVISPVEVTVPSKCPNCGTDLVWSYGNLICESENESQLAYRFITTIAPLDGAGWSLYTKIVEGLGLDSEDKLVEFMIRQRETSTEDIIEELRKSSDISGTVTWDKVRDILNKLKEKVHPATFLVACNIKGISWKTANLIFKLYTEFLDDSHEVFNEDVLYGINGVGWSMVQTLNKFRLRISRLSEGVDFLENNKTADLTTDSQFKVAITGALSVKRSDFDAELRKRGIEQSSNFNEIKYLITNNPESTSSKMKKAKDKGVEIISEQEFVNKYFN